MPAVPSWAPQQFDLTNPYSGTLTFNVPTAEGYLFSLDQDACSFNIVVRSTKDNVPQADGSILHHRFLTGVEMVLTVKLWTEDEKPACDADLANMLDLLSGSFRSLLNAGDNEGRLAWEIEGGSERMLDDARLLVYPLFTNQGGLNPVVTVTIDSRYPYAEDLNQTLTPCADGVPVTLTNTGTADFFPVFQVNRLNGSTSASAVNAFTIDNLTTGEQFNYSDALPGADPISAGGHYAEIDTFGNTIFLDGNGANLKAGVDELTSEYFPLVTGANQILISGCDMDVLWQNAWA